MTPVRDWRAVGDLGRMLDPDSARDVLEGAGLAVTDVRATYLRLKPRESALVGFVAEGLGADGLPVRLPGYVRTFVDAERATTLLAKAEHKRIVDTPIGRGVTIGTSERTVVYLFPNDGGLDGLQRAATLSSCLRLMVEVPGLVGLRGRHRVSSLTPVVHRPERRFVARVDADLVEVATGARERRDLHVRWYPDDRGARTTAIATALDAAGVRVPPQLGSAHGGRMTVEGTVPGIDAAAAAAAGRLDAEALGAMMARVHRAGGVTAPAVRRSESAPPSVAAAGALDVLAVIRPELFGRAARLAVVLRTLEPSSEPTAGVHGDLHLHQVIVGEAGNLTLLDFDRFAFGRPLRDVATAVAHLVELRLTEPSQGPALESLEVALRHAWCRAARSSDEGFGPLLATTLVDRALLHARGLQDGWWDRAGRLLDAAVDAAGSPRWRIIHPRPRGTWSAVSEGTLAERTYAVLDGGTVELRSPEHDPELPGLARALVDGELRAYRPGRRAVVAKDGGTTFVKVVRPGRQADLAARLEVVRAAMGTTGPRVPAVLTVTDDGTVTIGALPGRSLHDALVARDDTAARHAAIRAAAALLARFQARSVHGLDLPEASDAGTPDQWVEVIARVHPGLRQDLSDVAAVLPEPGAAPRHTLVHGDLHDRNVLLGDARGGLIDLDGAGRGDPALDLGNLAAHVLLRALQRGESAHIGRRDAAVLLSTPATSPLADRALTHGARTLFRLACLYRLRATSALHVPTLLDEAVDWADGRGTVLDAVG
jgi:aminoglycoside phosphotransferase (APT) family kinase protein